LDRGEVVKEGGQLVKISLELTLSWCFPGVYFLIARGSITHDAGMFDTLISICWRPRRRMVPSP